MTGFVLIIPGAPTAKGRPRVFQGHGITPKKTVLAENRIYAKFVDKYPNAKPLEGPVEISCTFYMSRQGKPDWDNLAKLATDALNGIAYRDDAQIISAYIVKIMPDRMVPGAKPGTMRKRKTGDPLTNNGKEYQPHTYIYIKEISETEGEQQ